MASATQDRFDLDQLADGEVALEAAATPQNRLTAARPMKLPQPMAPHWPDASLACLGACRAWGWVRTKPDRLLDGLRTLLTGARAAFAHTARPWPLLIAPGLQRRRGP